MSSSIAQLCKLFVHRDVLEGKVTTGKQAHGGLPSLRKEILQYILCSLNANTEF